MQSDLHELREQTLVHWMRQYGDAILHTCYLLCGDLQKAHPAAQRVFICAYERLPFSPDPPKTPLSFLLQIALEVCPCALCPCRIRFPDSTVSKFLMLPPSERKAAILCIYHSLPIRDAANILHISEGMVARRLSAAQKHLK